MSFKVPPSDSPNLSLIHPTPEEKRATWKLNGQSWRDAMTISTYLQREAYLEDQNFTRDGGITFWILVDATLPPNARPILSSCETLRKKAIIARGDGHINDITSHGIASVFCDPQYRGRGYAQRMIKELGKRLDRWQQKDGERTSFTILYSDIGKTFYSKMGWHAFPSSHIALPPIRSVEIPPRVRYLYAQDLPELCDLDEKWLRKEIGQSHERESKVLVALVPDAKTMQWHHAREEFAGKELFDMHPDCKGAYAETEAGDRAWCIWTRTFGSTESGNTLNILRFVIEGERVFRSAQADSSNHGVSNDAKIQTCAAILRAAQLEAAKWKMKDVQIWNPSSTTISAAQALESTCHVIHRDEESIASLRWHGVDAQDQDKIEWIGNEKYGWC